MQNILWKIAACLVAATACHVEGAPLSARQSTGAVPLNMVSPQVGPMIASITTDAAMAAARQTLLDTLLMSAQQQMAADPHAATAVPTLGALVNAHAAYQQLMASSAAAQTSVDPSVHETAAKDLYASVVEHYATAPDGLQQVQNLIQSDSNFAAANNAMAANRDDECDMLGSYYTGQYGKISQATKDCMCNDHIPYLYCRLALSNEMNTQTIRTMESTATDKRMKRIATAHSGQLAMADPAKNLMVNSTWQPPTADGHGVSRRGAPLFDPSKGEISAEACVGEVVELCVRASGTVPVFQSVKDAAGNVSIQQLDSNGQEDISPKDFFTDSLKGIVADTKLELAVSICLGLPGLTEVLNEVGISLCLDLLTADFFALQGPVGQLSTGLDLLIVKLSAWYKVKLANGSPVCPQDFSDDVMNYMCANGDVWKSVIETFNDEDYCNLFQGEGIAGVSVTLDLLFWSETWDFAQMPPQRDAPVCIDGKPQSANGPLVWYLQSLDCKEAEKAYLEANNDVLEWAKAQSQYPGQTDESALTDSTVLDLGRAHWLSNGRHEINTVGPQRMWPGRKCIDENYFCWKAQQQYWADNMDVADSMEYGPDLVDASIPGGATNLGNGHNNTISRNGGWLHFQKYRDTNSTLLWRGDLCANQTYYQSGSWYECEKSAKDYIINNPDILAAGSDRGQAIGDPNSDSFNVKAAIDDFMNFGKGEGRPYNKFLCYSN